MKPWHVMLLLAAIAAVAFAPQPEDVGVVQAVRAGPDQVSSSQSSGELVLDIKPRDQELKPSAAFGAAHWAVPKATPVKKVVKVEPPVAQAPPLPFKVMGYYEEDGKPVVFLQQNDRTVIAHSGDVLDGIYKVESLEKGKVTLTYLPLDQKQTLAGDSP